MAQSEPVDVPFKVLVNGPVVVITGDMGVALGMSPEAVLDSIEAMRRGAEEALRNRRNGVEAE